MPWRYPGQFILLSKTSRVYERGNIDAGSVFHSLAAYIKAYNPNIRYINQVWIVDIKTINGTFYEVSLNLHHFQAL